MFKPKNYECPTIETQSQTYFKYNNIFQAIFCSVMSQFSDEISIQLAEQTECSRTRTPKQFAQVHWTSGNDNMVQGASNFIQLQYISTDLWICYG